MKVLHIAAHLGGGIGKTHSVLSRELAGKVDQTFLLLETTNDRWYVDRITSSGARVIASNNVAYIQRLINETDVVQFESWGHPVLNEWLGKLDFSATPSVCWSHVSGLFDPLIPDRLLNDVDRCVFTSNVSLGIVSKKERSKFTVINSGFGAGLKPTIERAGRNIVYLGTVDFKKLHPRFFDILDMLRTNVVVSMWGRTNQEVVNKAAMMRHPERVRFCGYTEHPEVALDRSDIFLYPLRPDHYGTGENALIEAMSMGLVPIVLNNPSELAIVTDGKTGFVANSIEECATLLNVLLVSAQARWKVAEKAVKYVEENKSPAKSANQFMTLWSQLLNVEKSFDHSSVHAPA